MKNLKAAVQLLVAAQMQEHRDTSARVWIAQPDIYAEAEEKFRRWEAEHAGRPVDTSARVFEF
jgi:hypothetical protein